LFTLLVLPVAISRFVDFAETEQGLAGEPAVA
jgi:hypothetical protein